MQKENTWLITRCPFPVSVCLSACSMNSQTCKFWGFFSVQVIKVKTTLWRKLLWAKLLYPTTLTLLAAPPQNCNASAYFSRSPWERRAARASLRNCPNELHRLDVGALKGFPLGVATFSVFSLHICSICRIYLPSCRYDLRREVFFRKHISWPIFGKWRILRFVCPMNSHESKIISETLTFYFMTIRLTWTLNEESHVALDGREIRFWVCSTKQQERWAVAWFETANRRTVWLWAAMWNNGCITWCKQPKMLLFTGILNSAGIWLLTVMTTPTKKTPIVTIDRLTDISFQTDLRCGKGPHARPWNKSLNGAVYFRASQVV